MGFSLSDYLVTDDLSVLLGLIAATIFLLSSLYKPQPLAHPILLGRQSDVARVRHPKESGVYRNYGTGLMGRLPIRPSKDINVLSDLVKPEYDAPRTLWSTKITNAQLKSRVTAFGNGLLSLVGLEPLESNVLLLLNDGIEFLISDLALSSHSIPSFTLSSASLVSPVLESHPPTLIITDAGFLPHILELIYDSREVGHHTVIVVGEPDAQTVSKVTGQVRILKWADIESKGASVQNVTPHVPKPSDVFTVSFFAEESGQLKGVQLTHENLTAGVAAIRGILPFTSAITPQDTIVSAHSMSTAYGRAIAYTAVYEGISFASLESSQLFHGQEAGPAADVDDILSAAVNYPIPPPTILFIKPGNLVSTHSEILTKAKKSSLLYSLAWRQKMAGITEGFITKDSLWDRLVFNGARAHTLGDIAATLKAVIVSEGPVEADIMTPARIAFSVPVVIAYTHAASAAPVFASHPLDLQIFPPSEFDSAAFARHAHVGPPTINIEAKLVGVNDAEVESGGDPVGVLVIKGPPVGRILGSAEEGDEWVETGDRGKVQTNGAFKVSFIGK